MMTPMPRKMRRKVLLSILLMSTLATFSILTVKSWIPGWRLNVPPPQDDPRDEQYQSYPLYMSDPQQWQINLVQQAKLARVAGKEVEKKKKIVIGIASAFRPENYLNKTLLSLIENSDEKERSETLIVIYLADSSKENNKKQLKFLQQDFKEYLDSGFFQVILSSAFIYPSMKFADKKRTFNDSQERVKWRAKQVIDFTFLFTYSQLLSDYYLVMEDDVIASDHYLSAIEDFVLSKKTQRWSSLQFTEFLGIGLLFRSSDLPKLTQLLWMFYQEQPVDMLMREFIRMQVPDKQVIVRRIPSLFQHIGLNSTLKNKVQKITDKSFSVALRRFKNHLNPSAQVTTTMQVYKEFVPEYAYKMAPGYFWGIPTQKSMYQIAFPSPLNITRIFIGSGVLNLKSKIVDVIHDGSVEFGRTLHSESDASTLSPKTQSCDHFVPVAEFKNGEVDVTGNFSNVTCIRVVIGGKQKTWVIIREVQVFIANNTRNGTLVSPSP